MSERSATDRPTSLGEVLVLGAAGGIAVAIAVSLGLAQAGAHDGWLVAAITALALLATAALARDQLASVALDWRELLALAALGAVAAVLFLPGFPYAATDKDPGVYVAHAASIARTGELTIADPVLANPDIPPVLAGPGAKLPGLWLDHDETSIIRPQFFHGYPALLATANDIAGARAMFHVNPVVGVVAVLSLFVLLRRAFSWPVAIVGSALLVTNELEVWHAKYTTTEMLAQLLLLAGLAGVVVAIQRRSSLAAAYAGVLTGVGFLVRPEGLLLLLIAAGWAAVLLSLRRWDRRWVWFGAGVATTLPVGLLQAYRYNDKYASGTETPGLITIAGLCVALGVGVVLARALFGSEPWRRGHGKVAARLGERWWIIPGIAVAGLWGALLLLAKARPRLLGEDMLDYNGTLIRSYDEVNLHRLSWFFPYVAIGATIVGLLLIGVQRWRPARWAIVVPPLVMTPIYLWNGRVAPRLMWWSRRYVPIVLVLLVILAAVAIGEALRHSGRLSIAARAAAAALLAYVLVFQISQANPLRHHREMGGTYDFAAAIADRAGPGQQVIVIEPGGGLYSARRAMAGSLWLMQNELVALLPEDASAETLRMYVDAFPEHEIVLMTGEPTPPRALEPLLEPIDGLALDTTIWEEPTERRPRGHLDLRMQTWLWRVRA